MRKFAVSNKILNRLKSNLGSNLHDKAAKVSTMTNGIMNKVGMAAGYTAKALRPNESVKAGFSSGLSKIKSGLSNGMRSEIGKDSIKDGLKDMGRSAKSYLSKGEGTTGEMATRIGAVGAGYLGVANASRYISGGTMSRNSSGESDIAGIPFI